MIKAVLCVGRNGELGDSKRPDGLPWENNKEDLNSFKSKTLGSTVVMGRKTFRQLQDIGLECGLPSRVNIVMTKDEELLDSDDLGVIFYTFADVQQLFLEISKGYFEDDFWVIGGKSIYDQCMPYVEEVHITRIDKDFPEADTYMDLNFLREFELQRLTELNDYSIVYVYKRKK